MIRKICKKAEKDSLEIKNILVKNSDKSNTRLNIDEKRVIELESHLKKLLECGGSREGRVKEGLVGAEGRRASDASVKHGRRGVPCGRLPRTHRTRDPTVTRGFMDSALHRRGDPRLDFP